MPALWMVWDMHIPHLVFAQGRVLFLSVPWRHLTQVFGVGFPHLDVPLEVRINGWDQWVISPMYKWGIHLGL